MIEKNKQTKKMFKNQKSFSIFFNYFLRIIQKIIIQYRMIKNKVINIKLFFKYILKY